MKLSILIVLLSSALVQQAWPAECPVIIALYAFAILSGFATAVPWWWWC
jgi:hypothetical protein